MYTFLCQVGSRIDYDFVLETLNAIDFTNWYNGREVNRSVMVQGFDNLSGFTDKTIPVGTVEFVEKYYYDIMKLQKIKPVNIPEELFPFSNRKVWYGTEKDKRAKRLFCKSADEIKKFTDIVSPETELEKGNYMFSEVIEIDSEWRCFVLRGQLLGVHNYINSLGLYPDLDVIKNMVKAYKGLDAYTLDVGVGIERDTFVIEVHDFFSCGLYGFNNYTKLLQMLIASHNQRLRVNK